MIPAIEVQQKPHGYVWTIIANCGRVLVLAGEAFASDIDAFNDGKDWRSRWMACVHHIDRGE